MVIIEEVFPSHCMNEEFTRSTKKVASFFCNEFVPLNRLQYDQEHVIRKNHREGTYCLIVMLFQD